MMTGVPTKKNSHPVIWVFLLVSVAFLASIFSFRDKAILSWESATETFYSLHDIYRARGITRYLEEKKQLRRIVQATLKNNKGARAEYAAINIATYLFPDLLPQPNFERETALTLWTPFQDAIEKAPGTPESRQSFEELRSNIWNYENPNRTYPTLSPYAKQVIQIYDELSSPQ